MENTLSEKPYRIVFEEYPNYLYALVHGDEYGYKVLAGFLREISEECKKRGFRQVVIEENISAIASEEDVVKIASEMPQLGYETLRVAYIDRFLEQKEINEMGQENAHDHGFDLQIFQNQLEAETWLANRSSANGN